MLERETGNCDYNKMYWEIKDNGRPGTRRWQMKVRKLYAFTIIISESWVNEDSELTLSPLHYESKQPVLSSQ